MQRPETKNPRNYTESLHAQRRHGAFSCNYYDKFHELISGGLQEKTHHLAPEARLIVGSPLYVVAVQGRGAS